MAAKRQDIDRPLPFGRALADRMVRKWYGSLAGSVGVGSGGGGCLGLRWRARYLPSSQLRIAANSASSGVSHHLSSFVSSWSINNGSAGCACGVAVCNWSDG